MSNKDPKEICENCIHFVKEEGQCRKNAPRGVEGFPWPSVQEKHWCSEFEGNLPDRPSKKDIDTIRRTLDEQIH